MLKESLRMENARQETVATQVGARVEGNAIVPPDVGERAPLGSLPPPAGVGGALWEAKLRWLARTYGSMSSVRGATACGECRLGGYCHGSRYPGRPGLTLPDLGCATFYVNQIFYPPVCTLPHSRERVCLAVFIKPRMGLEHNIYIYFLRQKIQRAFHTPRSQMVICTHTTHTTQ